MTDKTKDATTAPAKPIKLLDGEKAIASALVSIQRRGATLQQDIHVAACSVLNHVGKHSDIRLVTELLKHMPDMARKNAVRDWFMAFGPVTFDGNAPKFIPGGKTKLGDAMKNPFWKFSPEKDYVPLDVAAAIGSLVKKLERDSKETKVDHGALIASLSKLAPANTLAA